MRHLAIKIIFGLVLILGPATVQAASPLPAAGHRDYIVKRDGEPIGMFKIDFQRDGNRLVAKSTYSIKVKLLAIVLYRYHKEMLETYEDGRLVSYETDIDDNGTKTAVRVARNNGKLSVTHPMGP